MMTPMSLMKEVVKKLSQMLRTAERGSLTKHPLVLGMRKGQSNPIMNSLRKFTLQLERQLWMRMG